MSRRDKEATAAAGFLDKRSHITSAGYKSPAKTYLFGEDVVEQRKRILARDKGCCVDCWKRLDLMAPLMMPNAMHRSHEIPKSAGGDDSDENLKSRCPKCHRIKDGHGQPMHF